MAKISHSDKSTQCRLWFYAGVTFIILGLVTVIFWPLLFKHMIHTQRILHRNSEFLGEWQRTPFPITFNVYFWNWTNPEDITNHKIKPKFQELGPYSYKHFKEKLDVIWNDNNDTVSFKLAKFFYFDQENSKGYLNDTVTSVDSIARSVAYLSRHWGYLSKKGISLSLMNFAPKIHVTKEVDEFLFKGYDSIIINFARQTAFATGITPPEMDKFGYLYGRNGTTEPNGYFNIATGKGAYEAGELLRWKYENHTGFFPGKCGKVHGSVAGDLLPPITSDMLSVFSSEQGRNFKIAFENEQVVEGIIGYKFVGGAAIMDNGTTITENSCYCVGECLPSGSINASTMVPGVPAFMTFPHFYDTDPYYHDMVDGMKANKSKHELYVVVEPNTGIPLEGAIRIQINMLLEPDEQIALYRKVPKLFIPILWLEEKAKISKPLAKELKTMLQIYTVVNVLGYGILILGFCCLGIGFYQPFNKLIKNVLCRDQRLERLKQKQEMPLKSSEELD